MKIGLVIISKPGGGAETVVYELQKYLSKKGQNVTLIANEEFFSWYPPITCDRINLKRILDPNFMIKRIFDVNILSKIMLKRKYFILPSLLDIYFKKEAMNIKREINDKGIDLLHIHDPYSLRLYKHLSKLISIPSIYTFHGENIDLPFFLRGFKHNFIKMVNSMDAITTVSKYMEGYLVSNGIRSDINVIENGIDVNKLKSIKTHKIELKDEKTFIIMFPGGNKKIKGDTHVVNAANILKNKNINFHLYIAGEVPKSSYLKNLVRKFDLNEYVTFLGLLEQDKYLRFLKSADLLVLPDESTWPGLVLFEALALNVPILTSKLDYSHGIFEDGKNCVFTKKEPDDIANKIMMLYGNKNFRKKLVTNNSEKLKKLDWNNITDQYIALYDSLLQQPNRNVLF